MDVVNAQLERLGLTHNSYYQPMLRRIVGPEDIGLLRTLADVVEPVKEYAREEQAVTEATSFTSLKRWLMQPILKARRPENFLLMVDIYLAGKADAATKAKMRRWLTLWQQNDAALQPLIAGSFLLQEDATLTQLVRDCKRRFASHGLHRREHASRKRLGSSTDSSLDRSGEAQRAIASHGGAARAEIGKCSGRNISIQAIGSRK